MTHRQMAISLLMLWLATGAAACDYSTSRPIPKSGIPEAVQAQALLHIAGRQQGFKIMASSKTRSSSPHTVVVESSYLANISSGTSGQLIGAYREQVRDTITRFRGEIEGGGTLGEGHLLRDFSFNYKWQEYVGIVRVYSFPTDDNLRIIMLCYEHPRFDDGPFSE